MCCWGCIYASKKGKRYEKDTIAISRIRKRIRRILKNRFGWAKIKYWFILTLIFLLVFDFNIWMSMNIFRIYQGISVIILIFDKIIVLSVCKANHFGICIYIFGRIYKTICFGFLFSYSRLFKFVIAARVIHLTFD